MTENHDSSRSLIHDLITGFRGRCPHCEQGKIFKSYLKITDSCSNCGEEFYHHRADDLPAYYVILIVGHIIVTLALSVETHYHPSYWVHIALWGPSTIIMALLLLQPIKGVTLALQWRMGMHGFKKARQIREEKSAK